MGACVICGQWAGFESWRKLCRVCYKKETIIKREVEIEVAVARAVKAAAIPEDKLTRLIMLCHPDKHGGSQTSTEITKWLLSLRKK